MEQGRGTACYRYQVRVRPREDRLLCDWHDPGSLRCRCSRRGRNVNRHDIQWHCGPPLVEGSC